MSTVHEPISACPVGRPARTRDDSVAVLASAVTRPDLDIPDPLVAAVEANYERQLARLMAELEADLGRFAAPELVSDLPAQLVFVTGWVGRAADFLSASPATGPMVDEALAAAERCLVRAGELMPAASGWRNWLGLSRPDAAGGRQRVRVIREAAEAMGLGVAAAALGFRSPDRATDWVATAGVFGRQLRQAVAWANSSAG